MPMLTVMPRWDYDLHTLQLIIHMASTLHKRFVDLVNKDISSQLSALANSSGKAAEFSNAIKALQSSRFFYSPTASAPHSCSKRSPDASFRHRKRLYQCGATITSRKGMI